MKTVDEWVDDIKECAGPGPERRFKWAEIVAAIRAEAVADHEKKEATEQEE